MTAAKSIPAIPRRRRYLARLWKQDYFVISHLTAVLEERIARHVRDGARVGDVGCGEQPFRALIESLGGRYIGIDVAPNAGGTVDILAAVTAVPLVDGVFDVIVCTEVLEHVSDTRGAMAEIGRLLVRGGVAIITTPFAYPLHEEPYDFVRLTPHQIRAVAVDAGLDIEELETTGNELEVAATVVDNLFSRLRPGRRGLLLRCATVATRLVVNVGVLALRVLFAPRLPCRYYLNVICVARRKAGNVS